MKRINVLQSIVLRNGGSALDFEWLLKNTDRCMQSVDYFIIADDVQITDMLCTLSERHGIFGIDEVLKPKIRRIKQFQLSVKIQDVSVLANAIGPRESDAPKVAQPKPTKTQNLTFGMVSFDSMQTVWNESKVDLDPVKDLWNGRTNQSMEKPTECSQEKPKSLVKLTRNHLNNHLTRPLRELSDLYKLQNEKWYSRLLLSSRFI